ncbi:hypothetical protein AM571_PC00586 (plasmid) [Rhizobium etli 8C-3]|uniref:Uncharacterized protein n=1 Tax=Rhizobium etli 8C-3 TaxID=538025 RepID=A0A1L5PDU4_RHIET|nr:hypothetical protein AM571_PC00586 [Rhizobium etli 8C-3]
MHRTISRLQPETGAPDRLTAPTMTRPDRYPMPSVDLERAGHTQNRPRLDYVEARLTPREHAEALEGG